MIEEKILYEYELFYMDCICKSKPGIYSKSAEIEAKKRIVIWLRKRIKHEPELAEKLMTLDNILETAYRYVKDYQQDERLEDLLEKWLKTIL